ncbi:hypothetical protein V7S43_009825 [Phytophthora oleae]|uniref:DUF4200 domain-containing protein n=1 Tax=Phytophthora oleae TaxID=2107226 RepID=A0ABD3FH31_9STRA
MAGRKRKARSPTAGERTNTSATKAKHRNTLGASQGVIQPPASATVLSTVEVTCVALQKKLKRDRQGRRQNGRRLKSEPFHLADNQKVLFARTYMSGRNDERPVDYVRLSNSCHFPTFAGNPDVLAAMEPAIVADMKVALVEQRDIEAKDRPNSRPYLQVNLAKVQALHQREITKVDQRVETLLVRLASSEKFVVALRKEMARAQEENQRFTQPDSHFAVFQSTKSDGGNPPKIGCHAQDFAAFFERQLLTQEDKLKSKACELATLVESLNNKQVALEEQTRAQDEEGHRLNGRTALNERMEQRYRDALARE